MRIIGLTGSIGMGKSTAAAMLRRMNVPVYCADEAVHSLLTVGGAAVQAVAILHPASFKKDEQGRGFIDRVVLGAAVFHDAALMKKLEGILHPMVRRAEKKFLMKARAQRRSVVVLDIPLLFETRGQDIKRGVFDAVMVVTAPSFIQRQRVLMRKNMNAEKFAAIVKKQMPDAQKRKRSDIIIHTGIGRAATFNQLKRVMLETARACPKQLSSI